MRTKKSIDFKQLATEKTALFIITSPVNTALACFANLVYGTAIKQLLNFAAECPDYRLPREVRLSFDDFAVGSKIHNFANYMSIFRSAGISAIILLQSESQLYSLYGEQDGQTIINNVSTYCYFSGGMDLTTCEHVARRINKSLETVLYSPLDRIYIMQAGQKPKATSRYPIMEDERFWSMRQGSQHQGSDRN
jgi:type IV secretory pathway TraG/TraD family ATPase VirD4